MENRITLVTGGCRSGKSRHALYLANGVPGENRVFMATSMPVDLEMEERIASHRRERGNMWRTCEEAEHVPDKITQISGQVDVILVDCMTFWISNLLYAEYDKADIGKAIDRLRKALEDARCPVILVSNEVGCGIVPEHPVSRLFRDMTGLANQKTASAADRVIWMVAGIPVCIKPERSGS